MYFLRESPGEILLATRQNWKIIQPADIPGETPMGQHSIEDYKYEKEEPQLETQSEFC